MEIRVPILKIKNYLIVPIQVDLDDNTASRLQHDILIRIEQTGARGVIIDISVLDLVDSYLGRLLGDTAQMAELMDARVVLTGMQPPVALTLVELGLRLDNIYTALDMESGIELLETLLQSKA
ncbi:MAG: STAS domain-containing protein [bacterium]